MKKMSNLFVLYGLAKSKEVINSIIAELNIPKDSESYFDIRFILTEALTNAFFHGNKNSVDKPIYLRYFYNHLKIRFEIEDSGNGFNNITIPAMISDEHLLDDCGRGLFMINALAAKVSLRNNTMIIEKFL